MASQPSQAEAPEAEAPIEAYHGSPHTFDRFESSKIGTGEGNQAFGHGLYFAEHENVAQEYKNALATNIYVDEKPLLTQNRKGKGTTGDKYLDDLIMAHDGNLDAAISSEKRLQAQAAQTPNYKYSRMKDVVPDLEALRGRVRAENTGHLYQVEIAANPDHFLDWDRPATQQHPVVQGAMNKIWESLGGSLEGRTTPAFTAHSGATGEDQHSALVTNLRGQKAAADALHEHGVHGIKYLDQGSRSGPASEGTHNYVVFDPSRVNIKRRY